MFMAIDKGKSQARYSNGDGQSVDADHRDFVQA
jgi:hypothetical protein